MRNNYEQLSKQELLTNLFIRTNKKFPHEDFLKSKTRLIYDYFEYSGIFYYWNKDVRFEIDKEIFQHFELTIDEMIGAVNNNTIEDFILLPTENPNVYALYDKNGDSVERILLNSAKLDTYLRTIDDGFGLNLYPAKYNLWYISIVGVPDEPEFDEEIFSFVKRHCNGSIPLYYFLDSNGDITTMQLL